jgi:hypothetical protein
MYSYVLYTNISHFFQMLSSTRPGSKENREGKKKKKKKVKIKRTNIIVVRREGAGR